MRRICAYLVSAVIMVVTLFSSIMPAYGYTIDTGNYKVKVNGSLVQVDVSPITVNDRMMVPLRGVVEKLGGTPEWDEANQMVTVRYKDLTIILGIESKLAFVNGVAKYLDAAPILYKDRTMVPIRFIAENMGMKVEWVEKENLVNIIDPEYTGPMPGTTVLGYSTRYSLADTGSYNSLTTNYKYLSSIATFSYRIDTTGNIKLDGESQADAVTFAKNNGVKPLMLIHNIQGSGFDIDLAHQVLASAENRRRLVDSILLTLWREGYAGVNVDLEHMYWYDRPHYSAFIKELKESLEPHSYLTTVAIVAKTFDSYENNNWGGVFDYKEIGKYADQVLLMTYDEHYSGGSAGPIASYSWVEKVIKYATSVMPSEKILMGIAGYGYDWASTGTKAIPMKNIDSLAASVGVTPQWSTTYQSPYFTYYKNGVKHEVWYENARSVSSKLDLVSKYNLGGIGIWRLGYDNADFWSAIKEKLFGQ